MTANGDEEMFSVIVIYCRSLGFIQLNLKVADDVLQAVIADYWPSLESYRYLSAKIPELPPEAILSPI